MHVETKRFFQSHQPTNRRQGISSQLEDEILEIGGEAEWGQMGLGLFLSMFIFVLINDLSSPDMR